MESGDQVLFITFQAEELAGSHPISFQARVCNTKDVTEVEFCRPEPKIPTLHERIIGRFVCGLLVTCFIVIHCVSAPFGIIMESYDAKYSPTHCPYMYFTEKDDVEHDVVAVGDVEAREVVDGGLGVVDVLVDHEGGGPGVLAIADADLAYGALLAEDVLHLLARDVEGEVADVQYAVHVRRESRVGLAEADRRHCWVWERFGFG
ncbi:hypothetical protein RHSIM_RhsimUnG0098200 [Rhododendron simsii]|uniref:Uncharacterized protein n=1 Tax=Rhododendron simsii TaxID=118357 RepID=A0A834FWJ2_RHOSS|nr:hypothetical protein RHSIM_RhsimUnG0098200 [Rhododendron simsii]